MRMHYSDCSFALYVEWGPAPEKTGMNWGRGTRRDILASLYKYLVHVLHMFTRLQFKLIENKGTEKRWPLTGTV